VLLATTPTTAVKGLRRWRNGAIYASPTTASGVSRHSSVYSIIASVIAGPEVSLCFPCTMRRRWWQSPSPVANSSGIGLNSREAPASTSKAPADWAIMATQVEPAVVIVVDGPDSDRWPQSTSGQLA